MMDREAGAASLLLLRDHWRAALCRFDARSSSSFTRSTPAPPPPSLSLLGIGLGDPPQFSLIALSLSSI